MGDLCMLAVGLLHQGQMPGGPSMQVALEQPQQISSDRSRQPPCDMPPSQVGSVEPPRLEFSVVPLPEVESSALDPATTATALERSAKSAKRHPQLRQSASAGTSPGQTAQALLGGKESVVEPALPRPAVMPISVDAPLVLQYLPQRPLPSTPRPSSNGQLFRQRLAALQAGQTYTRLPTDSFRAAWQGVTEQPTYEQWLTLFRWEAQAMAMGQGSNRLTVMLGDSISQWFPADYYSRDRFWLNQGISGDTTVGLLRRLSVLDYTRPDRIYLMAGINDLRQGLTDAVIVGNLRQIVVRLQVAHPQAQIALHSILPTQLAEIPAARIQRINHHLEAIAQQTGIHYLDLTSYFADANQRLDPSLTTDGLHLSPRGYQVWEWAMQELDLPLPAMSARYQAYY